MGKSSGIGVLDKAVEVLPGDRSPNRAGRPVCRHRTAACHRAPAGRRPRGARPARQGCNGRWCPGPLLAVLAAGAPDPLVAAVADVLPRLRDRTGESVQVYRRTGCPGSASPCGAAVGAAGHRAARLPAADERRFRRQGAHRLGRTPSTQRAVLAEAPSPSGPWPRCGGGAGRNRVPSGSPEWPRYRRRSRRPKGVVIAAVSVSGPVERIGRRPGARWAGDLVEAADALTARL